MEIHAYDEEYLPYAQRVLGDMLDFAVNTCGMEANDYFFQFIVSGIAAQFGNGNPKYVVGMTGCEVVRAVMEQCGVPLSDDIKDEMYLDKSPEYWAGWALCYYQWITGYTFSHIHRAVPISTLLGMYPALHEADITKFADIMHEKMIAAYPETNLKRLRTLAGLSQSELARQSGVSLRQIQLFEQRQRDINRTQALNLLRLARALCCRMEDLVEHT